MDLDAVRKHYESALDVGQNVGQKVGWRDTESQQVRFEAILQIMRGLSFAEVGDFGCGTGDLLNFLRDRGWSGMYLGTDISSRMITECTSAFSHDRFTNFFESSLPPTAEVVVASGIFNVCLDNSVELWTQYCRGLIKLMWRSSSRAIVFNMLSEDSDEDHRKSGLAYMNASDWLTFCRTHFSRHVRLDQAYGQYDFTIAVFREPPQGTWAGGR